MFTAKEILPISKILRLHETIDQSVKINTLNAADYLVGEIEISCYLLVVSFVLQVGILLNQVH